LNHIVQISMSRLNIVDDKRIAALIKNQEALTGMEIRPFLKLAILGTHLALVLWISLVGLAPRQTWSFARFGDLYFFIEFFITLGIQYFAGQSLLIYIYLRNKNLLSVCVGRS
ncbi:MAG: hypothetical protein ACKPEQ_02430, partial [Dolichospermum sp.]